MGATDRLKVSTAIEDAPLGDQLSLVALELLLLLTSESTLVAEEVVLFVCQEEVIFVLRYHLVQTLAKFDGGKTTLRLRDFVLKQLRSIVGRGNQVLDFLVINTPVAFSDPMAHFLVLHLNLNVCSDLLRLLQHFRLFHLAALRAVNGAWLRFALLQAALLLNLVTLFTNFTHVAGSDAAKLVELRACHNRLAHLLRLNFLIVRVVSNRDERTLLHWKDAGCDT